MTSIPALLPTNEPALLIGCNFAFERDSTVWHLWSIDANGDFRADVIDENDLARLTVEGIVPHAPIRPFEPNRFSKSRGRI
ncbi:hypothetical protein ACA106_20895 [Agrobacterium pusense]|uniref:hypothetical protein n=1 Tax=Agrobacterium pusense TaxID=648995 RepID=UPI0035A618DA